MWASLLTGVISGILSSLILSLFMFKIKPRVKISKDICWSKNDNKCRIKVVNLTRAYLTDMRYQLYACYRSTDGIVDVQNIPPAKDPVPFLLRYSKKDEDADYAIRLSFDMKSFLENPAYEYFEFSFFAKHEITGSSVFKTQKFSRENIMCGRFQTGRSVVVLREEGCRLSFPGCKQSCLSH